MLRSGCRVSLLLMIGVLGVPSHAPMSGWEQSERTVDVLWTTEGPPQNPFRQVSGIAAAPDGFVFIVDGEARSIYRFDPESGEYTWFDRRGEGPGELNMPYQVTLTPAGEVAVYDMGRRMILVYSAALEPLRQFVLRRFVTNPKGFAWLRDGSFIIAGDSRASLRGDEIFGVHRFDGEDGTLLGQYVHLPDPGRPDYRMSLGYIAGGPVFSLAQGGFLYSNSAPHRILRFDDAFHEHQIAADPTVVEPIVEAFATEYFDEERQRTVTRLDWYHDQARGIYELSDGRLLNIITRRHTDTSTWELWSATGELLDRFNVAEAWHPYGITAADDVLVAYIDDVTGENMVAALRWKRDGAPERRR